MDDVPGGPDVSEEFEGVPQMPAPAAAEALDLGVPSGKAGADQPLTVIAAAIVVGTVALMVLGVQPVLLEGLTQAHRLTEAQVGPLATVEDLALALGAGMGPSWMRSGAIRLKVIALATILAAADLAIYGVHSAPILELLRGAAGLAEGLMLAGALVIMIQHSQPDRLNAVFLGLSTLPQAAMAYALPIWVAPALGANGGFAILAVLALLGACAAVFLPDRSPPARPEAVGKPRWTAGVFVALAAVGLQNAAIGGAWSYLPLLVDQHHFPTAFAGIAVAGGLLFQVAGAFAVAAWGGRLPFRAALIAGSLSQMVVIGLLAAIGAPLLYIGLALIFGLFWLALSPFQVRLLIHLDKTRSAALLLTAVTLLGLSVGPFLSALAVRGADVTGAMWIAAALMAGAALLYILVAPPRSSAS